MEPKWHPKVDVFWGWFLDASGNIDGTASVAASVAASGTLSPADPPGRRHFIKEYCTIMHKEGWLAGSNTPRAVGPANYTG